MDQLAAPLTMNRQKRSGWMATCQGPGYQSAASSKDLRHKMGQKVSIGGTPGYVPPGYVNAMERIDGRSIKTIAIDEERAPFVPTAFEWFATDQHTYDSLRDALDEAGFRSRLNAARPAGPVSREVIEDMLHNRYYLGYVRWADIEYQGRHQPRVSQDSLTGCSKFP